MFRIERRVSDQKTKKETKFKLVPKLFFDSKVEVEKYLYQNGYEEDGEVDTYYKFKVLRHEYQKHETDIVYIVRIVETNDFTSFKVKVSRQEIEEAIKQQWLLKNSDKNVHFIEVTSEFEIKVIQSVD